MPADPSPHLGPVVQPGVVQVLQFRYFILELDPIEHFRVAACQRLDFGHGQDGFADIFHFTGSALTAHDLPDKPGLGFQHLPAVAIETAFGYVGDNENLRIEVALAQHAPHALFNIGRTPGGVQVVHGDQPFLYVHAGAHFLGGANEHSYPAAVDGLEQSRTLFWRAGIMNEGDLFRFHPLSGQFCFQVGINVLESRFPLVSYW